MAHLGNVSKLYCYPVTKTLGGTLGFSGVVSFLLGVEGKIVTQERMCFELPEALHKTSEGC
jgi:hypothetical protein